MKIIFARVTDMVMYQGITEKDRPVNGGSYVADTGDAHESYNFAPMIFEGDDQEYCLGFCQLPGYSKDGNPIELHIEKIPGCSLMKNEQEISGVTVVFCSKACNSKSMRVVGFYKNATVYRKQQVCKLDDIRDQWYSFIAKKEDCVLLPYSERHTNSKWYVPSAGKNNATFGFGRGNICYFGNSSNLEETRYVEKMIESVESYDGENWMNREVQ